MLNPKQRKTIINYYKKPESRLGYHRYLWGSKHFGFYPQGESNISERQAQRLLQDLVAKKLDLHQGQHVLDAGSGEGVVGVYLAEKYKVKVTGLTVVPFEKKAADKRSLLSGTSSLTTFKVEDYTDTSFPDGSFDAIYTTESLSHIPEPRDALKEFFRLLKPGGRLAMFEYTVAEDTKFDAKEMAMLDFVIKESGMFGLKKIRHGKLIKIISACGFHKVKQEDITKHIKPSFKRLNTSALKGYGIIKKLHLRKVFINTTASVEYYSMSEKDLIRYYIFTAAKP